MQNKWLGGRIPSDAWTKQILFFSKLLFRNLKTFPAIYWHVKRHTKWHLRVNFHDPDSTSQQDRLHFQFYSLVYKRGSFCRKWELIQIFTLKSNCSFIDQEGEKKKGCISLEYSVPRDIPRAKTAWNRSRAATSKGKPKSREGQAMPGRPSSLLQVHFQLLCNPHAFSSLSMIWVTASMPSGPLQPYHFSHQGPYIQIKAKGIL